MAGPLAALVDLFLPHAPQFNAKSQKFLFLCEFPPQDTSEQPAAPIEGIGLATAMPEGLVLDPPSALVELGVGVARHVERVGDERGPRSHAIRSYVSTLRKQDQNVLAGLRQLFEGHNWLPAGARTVTTISRGQARIKLMGQLRMLP